MKTISKVQITIILLGTLESNAAVCKSFSGYTVVTKALNVGKTRVPGNTMFYIYDQANESLAAFSADSELNGEKPMGDSIDNYKIESIFENKIDLQGSAWISIVKKCSLPYRCVEFSNNFIAITIEGQPEPVTLRCQ